MHVGVISNSEISIPLLFQLKQLGAGVSVFSGGIGINGVLLQGFCGSHQIPLTQAVDPNDIYPWLSQQKPDMLFVIDYSSRLVIKKMGNPAKGLYNIHFGPLPRYRGASPVFWQLKNNEPTLGVTIHLLTEKMDTGDIIWNKAISNEPWYTYTVANQVLGQAVTEGVIQVYRAAQMGIAMNGKPQDESLASTCKRPSVSDVMINWNDDAQTIAALIRACNDWNRGAITMQQGNEIKMIDAFIGGETHTLEPGTVIDDPGMYITIATGKGETICVTALLINQVFVPARLADKFGIKKSIRFQPALQQETLTAIRL
jgi:methionyl-tRNA formyltransferase